MDPVQTVFHWFRCTKLQANFSPSKKFPKNLNPYSFVFALFLFLCLPSSAFAVANKVNNSSTTAASQPSNMRHIVNTSDGTLHSFVQVGTQTATCGGSTLSGLLWFYSTDSGSSWTCGGQLSSDTTNLMYASATVDSSDNVYVVYSVTASGGSTSYDVAYRKLTKGSGATWTVGSAQTVYDSSASNTAYTYATIQVQGTTRLWIATRYYDGTTYQVRVHYSDGLTDAPTWTQSVAALDTAANSATYHIPMFVRYGSNIGIIYNDQATTILRWRFRADADTLTSWSNETTVSSGLTSTSPTFSGVGDTTGNIYVAVNNGTTVVFSYWNGYVWTPSATVSSTAASSAFVSVATDNTNVWVFYGDTTNLSASLSGSRKLVYKKGVFPFTAAEFDASATSVATYEGAFDKYWSYVGSSYTNDTTDAGNTTLADTQTVAGLATIAYFGKTEKFDSLSWVLSTNGAGGVITWEYWNGSSWATLSFTISSNPNFQGTGWGAFTDPADWATTTVNGEGTPYYYIRARASTAFTTNPVGSQFASIPLINWGNVAPLVTSNTIYAMWTENATSPMRVRESSVTVTASTANTGTSTNLVGQVAYSSTSLASQPSTMRHIVTTSDGTIHAFVQAGTVIPCGNASTSNNALGLNWIYSTDSGSSWTCGGQLSSDTTNLMYASATVDSADNVFVTYSAAAAGGSTAYDLFYRKLAKGSGSTWTVGAAQTVQDSVAATTAYTYATIQVEGTDRLWIATRYYDGTNYQVRVFYSSALTDAPTWTQSVGSLDIAANSSAYHYPSFVRFGSSIGIVYNDQTTGVMRWRYRNDGDTLTSWVAETTISATGMTATTVPTFSTVGDTNGNVYVATNNGTTVAFTYWNGSVWTTAATVSSVAASSAFVSVSTDGANVWVFYGDTTGLTATLSGSRKLVYKKGIYPFTATEFDANSTPVVSSQAIADKYWSYVSSAYTNDTTDAGNTTAADTQMVTGAGDIMYFGKTVKFDSLSWVLSTNGIGGTILWEYWNGSAWTPITRFVSTTAPSFTASGYISFIPNSNWASTTVNGEGTPYYYIRARATTAFTTTPVGTQIAAIAQITWANVTSSVTSNTIYGLWTENAASPIAVHETSITVSASTPNSASASHIITPVAYSSTTAATQPSNMRHIVRTSDGTLHAFIQAGLNLPCGNSTGANNTVGLNWVTSTDEGSTWTCGGQLSSNASTFFYASATVDSADNVYVVYSVAANGGNALYQLFYRKLTKGSGSTWTLGTEQLVLDASGSSGYSYATIEAEGTTRLWIAVRYFDGTNYQIPMYYSNGLTAAPTWTQSSSALETPGSTASNHYPVLVRFGSKVGVIYNDQSTALMRWRFRNDSDGLTTWSNETTISSSISSPGAPTISGVGDTTGNIYMAINNGANVFFTYWNGTVWSSSATVSAVAASSAFVSVATDGTNAWVFYGDITNLTTTLSGSRKLVYKKGVFPFTASEFDINSTPVVSYHTIADKYWSYVSSSYTNDTTDAGNTTAADTQMVTGVGDIMYFGKTAKFDSLSWVLSTNGIGGTVLWEYWNGSAWVSITRFTSTLTPSLTGNGYISFIPNSDWATTTVNGEGTPYYYVRARVVTAFSTTPVGTQIVAIPLVSWANVTSTVASNKIYALWTENGASTNVVHETSITATASTPNTATSAGLLSAVAYSSSTTGSQPSTMRHMVKTSDGTIHAFVQNGINPACNSSTGSTNSVALNWVYSTDSGSTWSCGGQLSSNISVLFYANATVDSSDNIYVVYSVNTTGGSAVYDTLYRKLTKGSGSTWTLGAEQNFLNSTSASTGYSYAVAEVEGSTRLWVAVRYYDGTNYQIATYYSDGLTATPTWTQSSSALDTPGTNSSYHYPTIVRYGSSIGVVYNAQATTNMRWRYRADSDGLTAWNSEATVSVSNVTTPTFSSVGDTNGLVYVAMNVGTAVTFTYWNGSAWSTNAAVSATAASNAFVSVSTYNASAWVFYGDTTSLSGSLWGSRKMVYKKGVAPFATANFDTNPTSPVSYHGTLDKYWSYVSSAYTNDSTDVSNVTAADTQMVTGVGDIMYFGKTVKFDSLSWFLSTNGIAGMVIWEYWNGSAWVPITRFTSAIAPSFTNTGYIAFLPNSDWATTTVNSEGTSYYYVRARTTTAYTTTPIGTQMVAVPYINWGTVVGSAGSLLMAWTENSTAPVQMRFTSVELPNSPSTPSSLGPTTVVDGSAINTNQPALQFTLADANSADTLQYRIIVDDSSNFGSPVVDYTSALSTQGAKTFTVGQAAGSGSYATGTSGQTLSAGSYYWKVMATDSTSLTSSYATANSGGVAFVVDTTVPSTNASAITMLQSDGGLAVDSEGWTKNSYPYFSWTAGADNGGGSGLRGYCLYLGTSSSGNPALTGGLLGTSPVSTTGTTCSFIVASDEIDFSTDSYRGGTWLSASDAPYYLNIKAVDNAGNIVSSSEQFTFYYDDTNPTNVSYISPASGNFSNVVDMNFSWPSSGGSASSDSDSGVLGWQYQLNSSSGTWQGTTHSAALDLDYIPATASAYSLVQARDGSSIVTGANTIYFRTVDTAGNYSSDATIRTGLVTYAGQAPTFGPTDQVTISPSSSSTNSFALSWPAATPGGVNTVAAYYYMVNTSPPSTYATLSGNSATYINNGTFRSLSARALPNVNKGSNTIYIVAVDSADTPNYSPSNFISGTFTLDSSDPDNVEDLLISDSSLKSQEKWNVALTWSAPTYQGAGNLTYLIYRSADGDTYTQVGSTSGLSYVDTTPESATYYYKVYTKDGANALSSGTNAVSIIPTGKWASAPTLESDPVVSGITTKKADITWSTSRSADSKVQFGKKAGDYFTEEPSNSNQVVSHTIALTNLSAGVTYYYRVKWTDEDGNTGVSEEFSFTTAAAPSVSGVKITNVSISSALLSFTVANTTKATVQYGKTLAYGLLQSVSTSTADSTYTVSLAELEEGSMYHLRIVAEDTDGNTYSGDDYTFETLPIPKIGTVKTQQVAGMPTATLRVLWGSNALVSSIVTYYPVGESTAAIDQINLSLRKNHEVILRDLKDETDYEIIIKGKDTAGNATKAEVQRVKTLVDLRQPEILNLSVESTIVGVGDDAKAQIIVSWDTDEPSTTQVEYAQGTGAGYGQSTQEDTNKTTNHVVTITSLTPSKIYHLRALSKDKASNIGQSVDTVVITPKHTQDALNVVIDNLSKTFFFLRKR